MIAWISAGFLVFGCVVLMRFFGLVELSGDVVRVARRSLNVIRSSVLNDQVKETALQKAAKHLWCLFLKLAFGGAAAVLLPVGLVMVCDRLGWTSLDEVLSVALSPAFLIAGAAVATLGVFVPLRKTRGKSLERSEN